MSNQLSQKATDFIDSVLRLTPGFAAFDCDGTLWSGDAGERFFDWEMRRGMVSDETVRWARARYVEYLAGKVSEDDMCAEMVTMNRGLSEADLQRAAAEFFEETITKQIFPELQNLVRRLLDAGCDVWAVSSTNEWVIRAAMKHFGISENKVLAATVRIDNGVITDQVTQLPSGEGKPRAIRKVVQRDPDAAFGNSRWDADMLKIARHGFAVNPNPDLEKAAQQQGWPVYWPDSVRSEENL
jgi:HAD superfamily phosphoserine phosphatase-like hydrolase